MLEPNSEKPKFPKAKIGDEGHEIHDIVLTSSPAFFDGISYVMTKPLKLRRKNVRYSDTEYMYVEIATFYH